MIKLNLLGDLSELEDGLDILSNKIGFQVSENGIPIEVVYKPNTETISHAFDGDKGKIEYSTKNNFYRLLNLFVANIKGKTPFEKVELVYFEKTGAMIDCSRNAVLRVDGAKEFLIHMAKLGMNLAMLYTEDTFEVEDQPYFGYLRGRYSQAELKDLDDFAFALGIEMIPCIQTLGHLYLALQYGTLNEIKDTSDVLLVGEPKTYEFIENIISTATAPLRSNRVHIGMDEAFGVGTGKYKQRHGNRNVFDILNKHVQKVVEITDKLGLEAMMWSDMYFRTGSETGEYFDIESDIPEEVIEEIPNVGMVFWNYYTDDKEIYDQLFTKHLEMNQKVIFAGGVWTWNGNAPNFGKTFETTKPGLAAAKEAGIKEVFVTMWGDDGGETPALSALPGLQFFADLCYRDSIDEAQIEEEFTHNTDVSYKDFLVLNDLNETPGVTKNNPNFSAGSKVLLFQDPLLGRFDKAAEGLGLNEHYSEVASKLAYLEQDGEPFEEIFSFYHQLAYVLSTRSEFGNNVRKVYHEKDREDLQKQVEQAVDLVEQLERLREAHQIVWMKYNKPFGWEVLDIRYGGAIARMKTVVSRLTDYLNGKLAELPELEEERLLLRSGEGTIGSGLYKDIVTTSKLSGV